MSNIKNTISCAVSRFFNPSETGIKIIVFIGALIGAIGFYHCYGSGMAAGFGAMLGSLVALAIAATLVF